MGKNVGLSQKAEVSGQIRAGHPWKALGLEISYVNQHYQLLSKCQVSKHSSVPTYVLIAFSSTVIKPIIC